MDVGLCYCCCRSAENDVDDDDDANGRQATTVNQWMYGTLLIESALREARFSTLVARAVPAKNYGPVFANNFGSVVAGVSSWNDVSLCLCRVPPRTEILVGIS